MTCGGDSTIVITPPELCGYWELEAKIYTQYNSNVEFFFCAKREGVLFKSAIF